FIDAGIGEAQINTILSALDIPIINSALLKRYGRIVGAAIEQVAEDSCQDFIRLEKQLTIDADKKQSSDTTYTDTPLVTHNSIENPNPTDPPTPTPIKASRDTAWTKRSSGHSYNSKNGYTSLIGYYSGKVISYNTRSTRCSRCEHGHPKSDHDCRENFDGSARAMEPDMSVELVTNNKLLKEENVIISVLIGDDDSSAIAAIRCKLFRTDVCPCFKSQQNNVEAAAEALSNIVPHVYGNHDKCGEWLKCHEKENNFIYKDLPKKQPLTDPKLFENLNNIFDKLSANASKLAPCGSSQSNESFNNIVINKHPKNKFYGSSESFDYRVAAAKPLVFQTLMKYVKYLHHETKTLNVYMFPTKMNYHASKVTGLHIKQNKLHLHNTCLEMAHNAFRFDALMILRHLKYYGLLSEFLSIVKGFSDTLPILKKHLPEIKKEKNGLKLTNLALKFLGDNSTDGAHNGETDVRILKEVLQAVGVKNELVKEMAETAINILEKKQTDPILEKKN
ncbi:hypothetical protein KQX54_015017, partial [Cotesia glomerata]